MQTELDVIGNTNWRIFAPVESLVVPKNSDLPVQQPDKFGRGVGAGQALPVVFGRQGRPISAVDHTVYVHARRGRHCSRLCDPLPAA